MSTAGQPSTTRYPGENDRPEFFCPTFWRFPFDFDALYRGESPAEGMPAMTTPPWDTKAPKENVIAWQEGGWVHGDVLDIGCGLGDNAIYLAQQRSPRDWAGHLADRADHRRTSGQ